MGKTGEGIINHAGIAGKLENPVAVSKEGIREILARARDLKGIDDEAVLALLDLKDGELISELFETAGYIKNEIYGNRLVLFAPLYVSNLCSNECLYCAFRRSNRLLARKALTREEIREEVEILLSLGHKRILLVAGESYQDEGLQYVFNCIDTVYSVKTSAAGIRRVNVNVAPLTVDEFRELKDHKIGTYQLFQETYHEETYGKLHVGGKKRDHNWRITAMDRAFEAGINDVGIGVLFGLADWRYEILALLEHIRHLEDRFGIGPHTISVPRLEPALGSDLSEHPPHPVSDEDFKKIIAVLRIAVPYTGMILSTRENAAMRRQALELGISQISAGSRTNPGGYRRDDLKDNPKGTESQFSLGDHRPMLEVIKEIVGDGYIPSFCTGCYRLGRTGKDFMDLAKPGLIKKHCLPNAILTFAEYLEDYADDELTDSGYNLVWSLIKSSDLNRGTLDAIGANLGRIASGERDIYF
ncbi:MAG: [FeFe] hydrogenase H-cluster radical SAM maturase HydG [Planctomycetota bacterium]|jgi:2-iminoacetate synthase